ncbi:uncharacterized protein PSFLO_01788 [Pseudozyma flocculosa]|uniref:GID complex catalytic subunit 2 n=1 Tax=Pseudozyma flocculosa TaxID=84751 RepID=A0A5C3EY47_9BASI|nr:uncharacterized protein PSFLO_01788 [Pseudozyma flocculosa]
MDALQKSLDQLNKRAPGLHSASSSARAAAANPTVHDSIDRLIAQIERAKASLAAPSSDTPADPAVLVAELKSLVDSSQRSVAERQKEFYGGLSKAFKALDKKFPTNLDGVADPALFSSPKAQKALERVILEHLLRQGDWDGAKTFADEAALPVDPGVSSTFTDLHAILDSIRAGDLSPAIEWAERERPFLESRQSPLEFALHRSQFIRIATGASPSPLRGTAFQPQRASSAAANLDPDGENVEMEPIAGADGASGCPGLSVQERELSQSNTGCALAYLRQRFQPFLLDRLAEIKRMVALLAYCPRFPPMAYDDVPMDAWTYEHFASHVPALYRPLLDPQLVHGPFLEPLFRLEYCARHRVAKEAPLAIGVEIGAGGALSHIIKVKTLMKERKNEWSQADELPVEIPVPPQLRFHSVFACPVSKEQGTETNPPMMLACGHVLCLDTLCRMAKGNSRFKCSYCPTESTLNQAIRVYF